MKKTINIILVLLLALILSSCFTSKDDVNKAKQDLWIIEVDNDSWTNLFNENENEDILEEVEKEDDVKKIEITSLTEDQFLELDDLSNKNLTDLELEITWKTIWNVDKIVVTFVNETSNFPVDKYTLKQFKAGDINFLYRAFSKYETLDMWKNVYIFEAYSGEKISKLQLVLNIFKEEEKTSIDPRVENIDNTFDDFDITTLPSNSTYWNPVDLWNWSFSYSDIRWLEIKSDINPTLSCETITSVLADKINSWFFWNTCRPIEGDEWVSFFVVRLDWDEYVYEKHYYLSYEWLYWVQELERWTWINTQNIWEKNTELKEKNEDFVILKITDELFKEILK